MSDETRKPVSDMTDREIAEETLESMRAVLDVFRALASHPMAAAMMPPAMRAR
jgi:hypothetical protein